MGVQQHTPFVFIYKGEVGGRKGRKGSGREKRGRGECWGEHVGKVRARARGARAFNTSTNASTLSAFAFAFVGEREGMVRASEVPPLCHHRR